MSNPLRIASRNKSDLSNEHVAYTEKDDKILWQAFTAGSESAFITIYKQYFQILYNYGCQFTGDTDLIKDCIQDIFISLRKSRKRLALVSSIKAYLFKTIRRKIVYELKKHSKAKSYFLAEPALDFQIAPSTENVIIERQFQEEQLKKINLALNSLSQRQREAIYFYYYNDLSYSEIKDVMGFSSIEAARNLLYRALTTIRVNIASL